MTLTATATPERLRVGIIAPPWVPVPPPVYGGTELVVDLLAEGTVDAAGHDVELFATGDSTCPVPRRWHYEGALGTAADPGLELEHVIAAYAELDHVDLIHDHTLLGPPWAVRRGVAPKVVTTNHGPFTPEMVRHYASFADRVPVIAISHDQRGTAPTVAVATVIHHGIDVDAIPVGSGDRGYLAFVGRMSPDKGVHRAIQIAEAAGRPLLIAAKMWEDDERRYFEREVEPHLGPDVRYVGEIGGARKFALLGGAEALLNPIQWHEPFGLVMIESLACGTPVLAFAEGATPEIVDHGRTGFLCVDELDMVRRLREVPMLDRAACRLDARDRFSQHRFVADHLALYRRVLGTNGPPVLAGDGIGSGQRSL